MSIANQAYKKDIGRIFNAIFFPGETSIFCINLDNPTNDLNFASFRLDIKQAGNDAILTQNVGTLTKMLVKYDFYNIKIEFVCPNLPCGFYQLSIFDTVTNTQKAISNFLQIEPFVKEIKNVSRVFFRNSYNKFGYNYEGYPDYFNVLTLPLIQTAYSYETDRKQYRNVSNKKLRNQKTFTDKTFTLESYYFGENGHDAMTCIYEHDTIFINHTFVTPKDSYQIEQRPGHVLCKGSINVLPDNDIVNPLANLIPNISVYNPDFGQLKFV